jgi:hypothetical protein
VPIPGLSPQPEARAQMQGHATKVTTLWPAVIVRKEDCQRTTRCRSSGGRHRALPLRSVGNQQPIHAYEEDAVETSTWESRHPALLGRLAGAAGLAYVILAFAPGSLGGPQYGNHMSTSQFLSWATQHKAGFPVTGFITGLGPTVVAIFVLLLVSAARGRGLLTWIAVSSAGALMAIDWVSAGIYYGLADAVGRSQASGGVVALLSLRDAMTYTDGFVTGIAILALSIIQLQAHALPRPLIWLGALTGIVFLVSDPIQLAINRSPAGVTGPIGVVLFLVWILAVAAALLIKPVWAPSLRSRATEASPAH